jgi:hypothetical protein
MGVVDPTTARVAVPGTGFRIAVKQGRACRPDMKTIQLAIRDPGYALSLRKLLLGDGAHRVYLMDRPNLELEGVVVIDESGFQNLAQHDPKPERFVIITRKGAENLSGVWDAGIRHVVFEEDPPHITQLAIIAAELRLRRCGKCGPKNANSDSRGIRQ